MFKKIICAAIISFPAHVLASQGLSLGVKAIGGAWKSDQGVSSGHVDQQGGQLGFSLAYRNERFFTGIRIQGGDYDFTSTTPDQITLSGIRSVSASSVKHGEFDLLAGYYFFERTAFFMDIKTTSDQWQSNDYQQNFSGLGLGVSSYYPLNREWLLYGSFGFIGNGRLETVDKVRLADASSSAIEIGLSYTLNKKNALGFGLNGRTYTYTLNDGTEQTYSIGGLFVNYQHRFDISND